LATKNGRNFYAKKLHQNNENNNWNLNPEY